MPPRRHAVFALLLAAAPAAAHIQLDLPLVRYSNDLGEVNKDCPCGGGSGGPTCTAGVTSDPNRDESRVTTLAPGSTITVRWRETIGHTGRHRVAFDDDGADLADFNAQVLADVADPNDASGERSVEVTLPNRECDSCTLQLIQDMNGDADTPITDPTGDATYFQCADMTLQEGAPRELEPRGCSHSGASSSTLVLALIAILHVRRFRRES